MEKDNKWHLKEINNAVKMLNEYCETCKTSKSHSTKLLNHLTLEVGNKVDAFTSRTLEEIYS